MSVTHYPRSEQADIALLLEGSYPFVTGGVSSWVHQILNLFPDYRFAIIYLGSNIQDSNNIRYQLPKNVVHMETHFLYDTNQDCTQNNLKKIFKNIKEKIFFKKYFKNSENIFSKEFFDNIINDCSFLKEDLFCSEFFIRAQAWDFIVKKYTQTQSTSSFIDYYWSIRNIHTPLCVIHNIIKTFPKVKCLHTISTGYAGYLGTLLHHYYNYPLILTEHGIYNKERRIELSRLEMIQRFSLSNSDTIQSNCYYEHWIRFFGILSRLCYSCADPIISLYHDARKHQIAEGAEDSKTIIVPNGIDIEKFKPMRKISQEFNPPIICLLGRVVPIKDIKTFIRAISLIIQTGKTIESWIVGPYDEDPEYYRECNDLIHGLDLKRTIKLMGPQNIGDILPNVTLLVLSSISEGLPLVILEGYAAGIPVIATDVGACRELIFGVDNKDKALGASGDVVNIANPNALANSILDFLTDEEKFKNASIAAVNRVETYYNQKILRQCYSDIYKKASR